MRNFENWLEAYEQYCQSIESPDSFITWAGISTIAAALQRKVYSSWETRIYANFFSILVSPPGQARKGSAIGPAKALIKSLGVPIAPDSTTVQKLIMKLSKESESSYDFDRGSYIEKHSSLTAIAAELEVLITRKDHDMMAKLCQLYDCDDEFINDTIARDEEKIDGVWLNILGATTPGTLVNLVPADLTGGGLASRMIFVCGDRVRFKRGRDFFHMSSEGEAIKDALIEDLREIFKLQGAFQISESFYDVYVPWYEEEMPEMCPFDPKNFSGYWSRRATHIRKLAMICSASRNNHMILEDADFQNALAILEQTEKRMPLAFRDSGSLQNAKVFEEVLALIKMHKELTYEELLEAFYKDLTQFEMQEMLKVFRELGYIEARSINGKRIIRSVETLNKEREVCND